MRPNEPPTHLLAKRSGRPLKTIQCGKMVHSGSKWTEDPAKASCHECARLAEGLTPEQRTEIWENANDRMGRNRRNPWRAVLATRVKLA